MSQAEEEEEEEEEEEAVAPPIGPGEILAGKYRIERVLGQGGMGVVVAATHLELEDKVAVKFLLPQALKNEEAVARFVREARSAVRIKNEHVARIIDVGRLDSGAPYMVMEYLAGTDLGQLRSKGPLPIEDAADYVIQACDAMADAHAIGIIHRDLKPANLFLTQRTDGSSIVKVLDFGISKVIDPNAMDASLTRTSTTMGSPRYMSPEQLRSAKEVDLRTDVWALGIILYELLSGQTPFGGHSYPELCAQILNGDPSPLRERRPEIPVELENIVLCCLQKAPTARFSTVADLARALLPFAKESSRAHVERMQRVVERAGLSQPSILAEAVDIDVTYRTGPLTGGTTQKTASPWTGPRPSDPPPRSRTTLFAALAGGVIVIALIVAYVTARPGQSPAASAAPVELATRAPAALTPEAPQLPAVPPPAPFVAPASASASSAPAATSRNAPLLVKKAPAKTAEKPKATAEPTPPPKPTAKPPPKKNPLDIGLK